MAHIIWSIVLIGIEAGAIAYLGLDKLLGINIISIVILTFLFCRTIIFSGPVPLPPTLKEPGKPVISYSDMKEMNGLELDTLKIRNEVLQSNALDHIILLVIFLNIIAIFFIA